MLRRSFACAFAVLVCSVHLFAQSPTAPTKQQLIGQFAELTRANKININVELSIDDIDKRMVTLVDEDRDLTETQKAELRNTSKQLFSKLRQDLEAFLSENQVLGKLGETVVTDVYDRAFTETELEQLIAFFKTPLGQKSVTFLATSKTQIEDAFKTKMEAKIQEVSQPLINSTMDELRRRIKDAKKK